MFQKFDTTKFPPENKPVLVWDGDCGFCKYWVTRWEMMTKGQVRFKTYQEVASDFPDIPIKEFKKASRFISAKGFIYSGPDSAYMSYYIANKKSPWHQWYTSYSWFTKLSDHGYNFIAKHRSFFFKLTKAFLGSNPHSFTHYWLVYLVCLVLLFFLFLKFL
ncbi:MAG: thiol-disulfide oxidoreductase [Flavobacteriaceae bacterium]|nr:thiol-disulfide oxidoreductase [Flavobacteriaceae bacterium]|tara:strand:- start:32 stop:514 length:483 start_codon:yes stop_codon:yes gene_type:complete